jgi:hypothetical protein
MGRAQLPAVDPFADGAGGGHAGILGAHGLANNHSFVLWRIGGSSTHPGTPLGAQAFQAEERRNQGIDIFEAVVERQGRTHRGLNPEAA